MPKRVQIWLLTAVELTGNLLAAAFVVGFLAPLVASVNNIADGVLVSTGFWFYLLGVLVAVGVAYSRPSPRPGPKQWLGWPWWARAERLRLPATPP